MTKLLTSDRSIRTTSVRGGRRNVVIHARFIDKLSSVSHQEVGERTLADEQQESESSNSTISFLVTAGVLGSITIKSRITVTQLSPVDSSSEIEKSHHTHTTNQKSNLTI